MRHCILLHVTWTTRDRLPTIKLASAEFLAELLPRIAHQERGEILGMGIVETHIHIAIRIHPATSLPRLLQRLKGASASLHRRQFDRPLRWAKGYNVDSVGSRALPILLDYVTTQHLHHPDQAIAGWPE